MEQAFWTDRPHFFESAQEEGEIASMIKNTLNDRDDYDHSAETILKEDLDTIKFHLIALGFMRTVAIPPDEDPFGSSRPGLILTERGKRALLEVKAVRATPDVLGADFGAPGPQRKPAMAGAGRSDDLDDEIPF
jgi:hypothetical protein